jgi:hypothetical protein
MRKSDYKIIDLKESMLKLNQEVLGKFEVYNRRTRSGYEWTGTDFAKIIGLVNEC